MESEHKLGLGLATLFALLLAGVMVSICYSNHLDSSLSQKCIEKGGVMEQQANTLYQRCVFN
jgi:hypothetical protein